MRTAKLFVVLGLTVCLMSDGLQAMLTRKLACFVGGCAVSGVAYGAYERLTNSFQKFIPPTIENAALIADVIEQHHKYYYQDQVEVMLGLVAQADQVGLTAEVLLVRKAFDYTVLHEIAGVGCEADVAYILDRARCSGVLKELLCARTNGYGFTALQFAEDVAGCCGSGKQLLIERAAREVGVLEQMRGWDRDGFKQRADFCRCCLYEFDWLDRKWKRADGQC